MTKTNTNLSRRRKIAGGAIVGLVALGAVGGTIAMTQAGQTVSATVDTGSVNGPAALDPGAVKMDINIGGTDYGQGPITLPDGSLGDLSSVYVPTGALAASSQNIQVTNLGHSTNEMGAQTDGADLAVSVSAPGDTSGYAYKIAGSGETCDSADGAKPFDGSTVQLGHVQWGASAVQKLCVFVVDGDKAVGETLHPTLTYSLSQ